MFSILLLAFLTVLIIYHLYKEYSTNFPPGPSRFPIIGSFHVILTNTKSLIEIVQDDRRKYGDISFFKLINVNLGEILMFLSLNLNIVTFHCEPKLIHFVRRKLMESSSIQMRNCFPF